IGRVDVGRRFIACRSRCFVHHLLKSHKNMRGTGEIWLSEAGLPATVAGFAAVQGANGYLVAATEAISPAIPTADRAFHFDVDDRLRQYTPPYNTNGKGWYCTENGACPSLSGVFDGVDDVIYFPTTAVADTLGNFSLNDLLNRIWLETS
ncbi:MAG: hypothetical protein KDD89_00015, partial [Anaerolineales bacterium]|nr:hypothetical protein [Anaerolineales bacterium]